MRYILCFCLIFFFVSFSYSQEVSVVRGFLAELQQKKVNEELIEKYLCLDPEDNMEDVVKHMELLREMHITGIPLDSLEVYQADFNLDLENISADSRKYFVVKKSRNEEVIFAFVGQKINSIILFNILKYTVDIFL